MSGEKGQRFFARLKNQLDIVLKTFRVHYHFFGEVSESESSIHDDRTAPQTFSFLNDVFLRNTRSQRISYVKNMDARATLFHHMNADMIVTTGSSFPLLAATISPKVCIKQDGVDGDNFCRVAITKPWLIRFLLVLSPYSCSHGLRRAGFILLRCGRTTRVWKTRAKFCAQHSLNSQHMFSLGTSRSTTKLYHTNTRTGRGMRRGLNRPHCLMH